MKNYRELNFTLLVNLVADDNEVLMVCEDFCLCLGDAAFFQNLVQKEYYFEVMNP